MKTLIILKSITKTEKNKWVKDEGLGDFYVDIEVLRKLYSTPELHTPTQGILGRSFSDVVYSEYLKILTTRMSKGCLIVTDPENESLGTLENLALIFGYTVFYVVQPIPQDYLSKPKKYNLTYYQSKRRDELEKDLTNYLNLQLTGKKQIKSFSDVEDYWNSGDFRYNIEDNNSVLHVSDLHSNYSLYKKLPDLKKYNLTVFHGDYIDGPEIGGSRKLIDEIIRKQSQENIIWLEGNHELRLRKYLGYLMLKAGGGGKDLRQLLLDSLPDNFLETTATEFDDLSPQKARDYLEALNNTLKLFVVIKSPRASYFCSHAGLKFIEQASPKYVGNLIYGNRDMDRYDRDFSERGKKQNLWSVHAHCKYPAGWNATKYDRIINLDPPSENEVVFAEQCKNNWNICQLKR